MAKSMGEFPGVSWTSPARVSVSHPQPTRRRRVTMKKHIVAAAAAALAFGVAGIASAASAPCLVTYAHPSQAKQIKSALVQAFVSCNNPGGNTPNGTTETGTAQSCFPAETFHQQQNSPPLGWTWGPKSKGD